MLTPKQENFCLAYLETGNASEAYRRAYYTARMKTSTVQRKAKELLHTGPITARIDELREPIRNAALVTLEKHIKDMERLRDEAREAGQYSAAIRAEECRAKASGVYEARARFEVHGTLSDTGRGLLKAIGNGQVTAEQGHKLLTALGSLARVVEVDEIVRRVESLETGRRDPAGNPTDSSGAS